MKNLDISYQNREMGDQNPFVPTNVPKTPIDSRLKLVIALVVFIFILLILSLVATVIRKTPPSIPINQPTPTLPIASPTGSPNSAMPTEFQEKFNQIDQDNQTNINFPPPQIDPQIGQ